MFQTTDDLYIKFRAEVDDKLEGLDDGSEPDSESLWKDHEIYGYMTEAADAVARGLMSLYKLYELPVVADENRIRLPGAVLDIRDARLLTHNRPVVVANEHEMLQGCIVRDYGIYYVSDLLRARGCPRILARDRERGYIVVAPTPTENDTLEIQCCVTLSAPLYCGMLLPFKEIPDTRLMLHYMKYLAYAKQDADTLDLSRSNSFKALFDAEIIDRELEFRRQRRVPSPIRMEW